MSCQAPLKQFKLFTQRGKKYSWDARYKSVSICSSNNVTNDAWVAKFATNAYRLASTLKMDNLENQFICIVSQLRCCKLKNEILKKAKNVEKWPKMIILRPKNVIFERFWPLSKLHFSACSTLPMIGVFWKISESK